MTIASNSFGESCRIACDECGAVSELLLHGTPAVGNYFLARIWLRAKLACQGWTWQGAGLCVGTQKHDRCPKCSIRIRED